MKLSECPVMATAQLRELEREGIISRTAFGNP
jgi:DNA-binding HxlR family transcriptional regulator